MIKYPSIEAFRNVIRAVQSQHDYQGKDENGDNIYLHTSDYPTLSFTGTVKLHGCFPSKAKVKMFDGTEKAISKIKCGDVVLGYNEKGELVPSKVLTTMTNGKTELWYKIAVDTKQLGGVKKIVCTANHEIYTSNRGYVEAKDLNNSDKLLLTKESFEMSNRTIDILNGKLLGDGHIHKQYGNLGIVFGHKAEHEEYIDYCLEVLDFWGNPTKRIRTSGYGSKMIDVATIHDVATEYHFNRWLNSDGKKTVPELTLSKYTLAYWYMDDGSLSHTDVQQDRANFAICGFSDEESERLISYMKEYGFVNPVLYKADGYNKIRLNKDDAEKLFLDIRELIPPVMQYKLPMYHRGFFKEIEKEVKTPKFYESFVSVKDISTISSEKYSHSTKYDIETETHNYFVNSILVHNSNAGIVRYKDGNTVYQSRERELSLLSDNAGFAAAMMGCDLEFLFKDVEFNDHIAVYGEWCGGNIQKGVAINGLPKMFVIFGVKVDGEWIELSSSLHSNEQNIYNILQFPTYEIDIDFNNPELSQNKLIELTIAVEEECPVGKFFGKSGIGEGIVFTSKNNQNFKFKSKGEKHSSSKVKTLNAVDVESLEGINDFVELAVSENRLKQGLTWLQENQFPLDAKSTGEYLKWITADVFKEESDTIVANKLDAKKIRSAISVKARNWFLNSI